jgi:hypothetical protein
MSHESADVSGARIQGTILAAVVIDLALGRAMGHNGLRYFVTRAIEVL